MTDVEGAREGETTVEDEQRRQESLKLLYDWYKHSTTLSTGSILIAIGLVQALFSDPEWAGFVIVSAVFMLVSLGAAVVSMMGVVLDLRKPFTGPGTDTTSDQRRTFMRVFTAAWGCFLFGVGLFVAFALKNSV